MFSVAFRRPVEAAPVRDPFAMIDAMFSGWAPSPAVRSHVSRPRMEVVERADAYEVRAELPGVNKEDIQIDVDGTWVAIRAKASAQREQKEGETVIYSERRAESFSRTFELPQAVDLSNSTAQFDAGVLTLTLTKQVVAPKVTRLAIQ